MGDDDVNVALRLRALKVVVMEGGGEEALKEADTECGTVSGSGGGVVNCGMLLWAPAIDTRAGE